MNRFVPPIVCAVAVLGAMTVGTIRAYDIDQRGQAERRSVAEKLDDDRQLCRAYLGIGLQFDFGQRKLMMACAADAIAKADKAGERRSISAAKAWDTCMPDLSACDRALAEAPHP